MQQLPPEKRGKGAESLRPIDDLLKDPLDPGTYPNLVEDYHNLADKDFHLAELYRLAATNQVEDLQPNPVQAVIIDNELMIDVLAEIEETTAFKQLQEIMQVHTNTRRYISGQIAARRLPELNRLVKRVQTARPIRPAIYESIPSIHADQQSLRQQLLGNNPPPDGTGVIVGIVDIGCDFVHPNFRDQNDQTRLLFLWDQRGGPGQSNRVPYGREFNPQELNQALNQNDPYKFLNYQPKDGDHGTHVMDIAAGSSTQYPGVAPGADLIFVHLGMPSPIDMEEGFLGSSKNLYDAVKYIFDKASAVGKPAVVNLSLATNGGAHDGTSMVESMFDDLLDTQNGRAIVVAAGNSYQDDAHTMGTVVQGAPVEVEWFIQSHTKATWDQRQEMEIWYESPADFDVEIFAPNGQLVGSCPLGEIRYDKKEDAKDPIMLVKHHFDPIANEKHINVFIDDRYPKLLLGAYRFRLGIGQGQPANNGGFHAWIERNDAYPSNFTPKSSKVEFTINSIGNASLPIVVGAYNTHLNGMPISFFSSAGPSRNQNASQKPEISAPGFNIFAARALHSDLDDGTVKSGTSMAAPHVTGIIALLFQAASENNPPLMPGMDQIRKILIETADRNPPQLGADGHDPRYGFGRVNGANALKKLLS